jgi:hypothetical protein
MEPPLLDAAEPLIMQYREALRKQLQTWTSNILESDHQEEPTVVEGLHRSLAPNHLFKAIYTQIDLAKKTNCKPLVIAVIEESIGIVNFYQKGVENLLKTRWKELHTEYITAQANNSARSIE